MKQKILFVVLLTVFLNSCAILSGPPKPPRCNGKHTRILNQDKWNGDSKDINLPGKVVKHVTTPVILNTLESEKATTNVTPKSASQHPINHKMSFDKTVEVPGEK
ncbi:type IV secretion system protein VirB7 [Bartonella raoultii]|uniref:Type IV secretion system protein VirB7 n=1 Tax=Bartonella raoultii TaxID=1457020 RepID=A0ABS7I9K6_9HYPH|nr:type IV secretion system protein VirB7 [Bartonella raoultii]MBX4335225.1 type IV secretion system protein VirB7 [Bartonella raoultii]